MNPILRDFKTTIETERLIIRQPKIGDGKAVNDAIKASMPELKRWMPFAQELPTPEETEENIRQSVANWINRTNLRMLIFRKDTGEFIASSGFHGIDWDVPKVEIGYWMDTCHTGQGFMTEAVEAQTEYAFSELGVRRVQILCDEENSASRAVPERLGYKLEGIHYSDSLHVDGKTVRNTVYYSKTR
ncbi:GNAT family N-acetyltransferase [Terribacillus saccharophilus]|uniref:GNAT family N-acetyltransferase n=1 Tax=Terribacillus saccharophilus TaxID=361277 RepID=A0A268AFH7_9BACI|nr:GNAT family N-acetyltransferase [Terribacillus saccharophilus]PAD22883.1 GNAT family N-acetyltransferase [Terribacillus saccharophilus]